MLLGDDDRSSCGRGRRREELELDLKGKSEPLVPTAWSASQARRRVARRLDAPLVGRERELRRLRDAFGEAARVPLVPARSPCSGTAGVGKSRLVAEFLGGLDGARVVRGRCLPYGDGITYWPVIEVARSSCRPRRETLDLDRCGDRGDRRAARRRAGDRSTEEIAWAVRKLLEARGGRPLVVVVFDDIHWARADTSST